MCVLHATGGGRGGEEDQQAENILRTHVRDEEQHFGTRSLSRPSHGEDITLIHIDGVNGCGSGRSATMLYETVRRAAQRAREELLSPSGLGEMSRQPPKPLTRRYTHSTHCAELSAPAARCALRGLASCNTYISSINLLVSGKFSDGWRGHLSGTA